MLSDHGLAGRTVLVRAGFDNGIDGRLVELLRRLAGEGARVAVIAGHGDPLGDINPALSLRGFAAPLSRATGRPVIFIAESVGAGAEAGLDRVAYGAVALLENLRFHSSRRLNARTFALRLSVLGDYFIDAGGPPAGPAGWQTHLSALLADPLPRLAPQLERED